MVKRMLCILLIFAIVMLVSGLVFAEDLLFTGKEIIESGETFQINKEIVIDSSECTALRIMEMRGPLTVVGNDNVDNITVKLFLSPSNLNIVNDFGFFYENFSDEIWLEFDWERLSQLGKDNYRIEIIIPSKMNLVLGDAYDKVKVFNINSIDVSAKGEEIYLSGLKGSVRVRDNEGNMILKEVNGDVWISDVGGRVVVEQVVGIVTVDSEASLDLVVKEIIGDVNICANRGGLAEIRDIKGNVSVFARAPIQTVCDKISGVLLLPEY